MNEVKCHLRILASPIITTFSWEGSSFYLSFGYVVNTVCIDHVSTTHLNRCRDHKHGKLSAYAFMGGTNISKETKRNIFKRSLSLGRYQNHLARPGKDAQTGLVRRRRVGSMGLWRWSAWEGRRWSVKGLDSVVWVMGSH